jgi:hypothetical protein
LNEIAFEFNYSSKKRHCIPFLKNLFEFNFLIKKANNTSIKKKHSKKIIEKNPTEHKKTKRINKKTNNIIK